MNEEQQNQAKSICHAIDRTMGGLTWAHANGDPGARAEFMRHLARLHDIECAILAVVKFDVSAQEDDSE
jgi:hypothetical protein